jgi:hypothetical protein
MTKSRYIPNFDCEESFRNWLEQQFIDDGWLTWSEVYPESDSVRADLIVRNREYGSIGIECKYMPSPKAGKKVGKALEQIVDRYRGKTYNSKTVDLWAFAPYFYKGAGQGTQTIRELLCHFGIGVIWTHKSHLKVDFAYSDRDTKILVKHFYFETTDEDVGEEYGDIDEIEKSVLSKVGKLVQEKPQECQYDSPGVGCNADAHGTVEIGDYEIQLCKHHIRKLDRERAADVKHRIQKLPQSSD